MAEKEYKNVIQDIPKTESEILALGANSIIEGQMWVTEDTHKILYREISTGNIVEVTSDVEYGTTAGTACEGNDARLLSVSQKNDLTDSGDTTLHHHDSRYYTESEIDSKVNHLGSEGLTNTIQLAGTVPDSFKDSGVTIDDFSAGNIKRITKTTGTDKAIVEFRTTDTAKPSVSLISVNDAGGESYLTNDGTTISTNLKVVHPKATSDDQSATLLQVKEYEYPYSATKDPTGWDDPSNIDVSYNGTNRTVTLTAISGTMSMYWRGKKVAGLSNITTWTSSAHAVPVGTQSFFLFYNGTFVEWSTTPWEFDQGMIAMVYRDGVNICLRECHGAGMDYNTHRELHDNIGTYLKTGGDMSGYTLASITATNRRPQISQASVYDEDLPSILPALTTNAYSQLSISGASTTTVPVDNPEIVSVDGTSGRPFYNLNTAGTYSQAVMSNNQYQKIFVMAIPVSSSADCQKARFIFVQGQTVSTNLSVIQALTPASISLGTIAGGVSEYAFIGEIIIQATSNNWQLTEVKKLTGGRFQQISTPPVTTPSWAQSLGVSPSANNIDLTGVSRLTANTGGSFIDLDSTAIISVTGANTIELKSDGLHIADFQSTAQLLPNTSIENINAGSTKQIPTREYVDQFKSVGTENAIQVAGATAGSFKDSGVVTYFGNTIMNSTGSAENKISLSIPSNEAGVWVRDMDAGISYNHGGVSSDLRLYSGGFAEFRVYDSVDSSLLQLTPDSVWLQTDHSGSIIMRNGNLELFPLSGGASLYANSTLFDFRLPVKHPIAITDDQSATLGQVKSTVSSGVLAPTVISLTTSATTSNQIADTTAIATYRTIKYVAQVTSGTSYQSCELLVCHNGTTAYVTEFANIETGSVLTTFSVDISGGSVRLLVTPVNAVTVYKIIKTVIPV